MGLGEKQKMLVKNKAILKYFLKVFFSPILKEYTAKICLNSDYFGLNSFFFMLFYLSLFFDFEP